MNNSFKFIGEAVIRYTIYVFAVYGLYQFIMNLV